MLELKDILTISLASLALVVSAVTGVLSLRMARLSARNSVRPVIVFECDKAGGWCAKNIGSGSALNVIVAQNNKKRWHDPVRGPALPKEGRFFLSWCPRDIHRLGALYEDVNGFKYTTTCSLDLNRTTIGHNFGPWREDQIGKHWADGKIVPPI